MANNNINFTTDNYSGFSNNIIFTDYIIISNFTHTKFPHEFEKDCVL